MYKKRLIATIVSIFTLGVIFGIYVFSDTFSFCAILAVFAVLSVILHAVSARSKGVNVPKYITAIVLAVAVFSFGGLCVSLKEAYFQKYSEYDGIESRALVKVEELSDYSLDARIVSCEAGVPKLTLIRLYSDNFEMEKYIPGDLLTVDIKYSHYDNLNYASQGIKLTAQGTIVKHETGRGILYAVRKSVYKYNDDMFGSFESAAAISKGVTIGDRSSIDSYLFSIYRSAGLSHVLAISGLHISVISMTLYNFLRRLNVNFIACAVVSTVVAFIYAALVGFNAGAVRSVIMLSFIVFLRVFSKQSDGFTTISIALFVLLVINPYALCSAGFQLSFLCCFAILLVEPFVVSLDFRFIEKRGREKGKLNKVNKYILALVEPLFISVVTSVFSFPIIVTRFDSVSCISPIVNVIAVPIFTLAIEISMIAYLVAPFSISLGKIIAYPAGLCFDFVTDISQIVHDMGLGVVSSHIRLIIIPLLFALAMIACLMFLNKKRSKGFVICLSLFCTSLLLCHVINGVYHSNVSIVEYGSKDSEYVYTTAEGGAYVDMGGYLSSPGAVFENGKTMLRYYVTLNYSNGTYKRLDYMLGSIKVEKICLPTPKDEYDYFILSQIKELASKRNCDIMYFEDDFYGVCPVALFINDGEFGDEVLISADINGSKVRILGDGFSNAVNCDVAIVTDGFLGESNKVYSDIVYASKSYLSDRNEYGFESFDERLRIEIKDKESDYKIYEP